MIILIFSLLKKVVCAITERTTWIAMVCTYAAHLDTIIIKNLLDQMLFYVYGKRKKKQITIYIPLCNI